MKLYLSKFTLAVSLPQAILSIGGLTYYALNDWSWEYLLWTYIGWVFIGVFGVSLTYHKVYAHRSFVFRPTLRFLEYLLAYLGMMSGQGSPISYAAIHRCYHHRYSDTSPLDPHSPRQHGLWHAYYGWHFSFKKFHFVGIRDLLKRPVLSFMHKYYYPIFLCTYFLVGCFSLKFLVFCVAIPGFLHVHEMNILNSFSHKKWFGYRNFDTEDDSVNNFIFGILTWGTGFHNNHHAKPQKYHNWVKWYEFDPFRFIVPILGRDYEK